MALDNVNHSSSGAIDGNQATGFQDELNKSIYNPRVRDHAVFHGRNLLSTDVSGKTIFVDGARSEDIYRPVRDTVKPHHETESGDFQVAAGVTYWSVSKVLAGRLKGAEATAAEILGTMRELVKFNGKTMAEASKVDDNELIRVPSRFKTLQA